MKANQNARAEKHNGHKPPEPAPAFDLAQEFAPPAAALAGPLGAAGDGTLASQAARLGDAHMHAVQRQTLAAQIGRVQGNRHLQWVLANLPVGKQVSRPVAGPASSSMLIQRWSPVHSRTIANPDDPSTLSRVELQNLFTWYARGEIMTPAILQVMQTKLDRLMTRGRLETLDYFGNVFIDQITHENLRGEALSMFESRQALLREFVDLRLRQVHEHRNIPVREGEPGRSAANELRLPGDIAGDFWRGFERGLSQTNPEISLEDLESTLTQVSERPGEFYNGLSRGFSTGLMEFGVENILDQLLDLFLPIEISAEVAGAELARPQLLLSERNPIALMQELRPTVQAILEILSDPEFVMEHAEELGELAGQEMGQENAQAYNDFMANAPWRKGYKLGRLAGYVFPDIIVELALLIVGRGATAVAGGGRTARFVQKLLRHPRLRRLRQMDRAAEAARQRERALRNFQRRQRQRQRTNRRERGLRSGQPGPRQRTPTPRRGSPGRQGGPGAQIPEELQPLVRQNAPGARGRGGGTPSPDQPPVGMAGETTPVRSRLERGRGTQSTAANRAIVPNDPNRLHHIFGQPKHKWHLTGLSQSDNISLMENIADNPGNLVSSIAVRGGQAHTFRGVFNGLTIEVRVFENASGTRTISDGWVL